MKDWLVSFSSEDVYEAKVVSSLVIVALEVSSFEKNPLVDVLMAVDGKSGTG